MMNKHFLSSLFSFALIKYCVICLVLNSGIANAQDITIEFSNVHDKLYIRYTNTSQIDYYLPSLFLSGQTTPSFVLPVGIDISVPPSANEDGFEIIHLRDFKNNHYLLPLDYIKTKVPDELCLIPDDGKDTYEIPLINYYLSLYYKNIPPKNPNRFFSKCEKKRSKELRNINSLLFLKAGETQQQFIDISGLILAEIQVKVYLPSLYPPSSLQTGWKPEEIAPLPEQINGYKLYKRPVRCNCIVLDFTERP